MILLTSEDWIGGAPAGQLSAAFIVSCGVMIVRVCFLRFRVLALLMRLNGSYTPRRVASADFHVCNISCHHCASPNNGAVTDSHTLKNNGPRSNEDITPDFNRACPGAFCGMLRSDPRVEGVKIRIDNQCFRSNHRPVSYLDSLVRYNRYARHSHVVSYSQHSFRAAGG